MSRTAPALRPALEQLELRENPSAVWAGESFDGVAAPSLPTGWATWSGDGSENQRWLHRDSQLRRGELY